VGAQRTPGDREDKEPSGREGTDANTEDEGQAHPPALGARDGRSVSDGHHTEGLTNEPRPAPRPGLSVRLALINGNSADAARARPRGARGRSARRRREERRALEERSGMRVPDGASTTCEGQRR